MLQSDDRSFPLPTLHADFLEPLWTAFSALIPEHVDTHAYGGHRPRISDRLIFERLLEVVCNGLSYENAATARVSATTLRRRRDEWVEAGVFERLKMEALRAYDKMIGLDFTDISIDGCITKAPNGGELAGPSPVDRGKGGFKRSTLVDANGIPIYNYLAPANRNDSILLLPTLDGLAPFADRLPHQITVHPDAGYDSRKTRFLLHALNCVPVISQKGTPLQAGKRWRVESAHSWYNSYAVMRVCRERNADVAAAWTQLVTAIIVIRKLVAEGWIRYRWEGRAEIWKRAWGRSTARRIKRKANEHGSSIEPR